MLSIIVPVYNESDNLLLLHDKVVLALEAIDRLWELIFVNDGSSDGSAAILDSLSERDSRIKVIHFRRNYGQTAAMMAGIDFATGEILIPLDADLQNDPADISRLVAKLDEGYDVCSGWRKQRQDSALRRNLPSRLANKLISWVSGVPLHDYGCSLKAYRSEVIKGVRLYGEMHRFIPIYAKWHGAKVTEIPVNHSPRLFGQSSYGLERIFKVILDLAVVKFLDRYYQKPIYIFGGFGLLSIFVAFISGVFSLYLKVFKGVYFIQTPLPLLVVMTTITGVMCILMGLLAEMVTRAWHESKGRPIYMIKSARNLDIATIKS